MEHAPSDSSHPSHDLTVSERRASERRAENRPIELTVEGVRLQGHSRDTSDSSLFLLADGELRVTVRYTDGEGEAREGRLIRYQRMGDGDSGWAVEFGA